MPKVAGSQKLIDQRKAMKAENQAKIRKVLTDAGQPLTAQEIASRAGVAPSTVTAAAGQIGLHRKRSAHADRGSTLMGANPYIYWLERSFPKRTTPIEATATPTKPRAVTPSPVKSAFSPRQQAAAMEAVRPLSGGRMLLADAAGELWVASPLPL